MYFRVLLFAAILWLVPHSALGEAALVQGTRPDGGYTHSYSANHRTRNEAISSALQNCSSVASNCSVLRQFNMFCFAMVYSQTGGWAFDFGYDILEAERKATRACNGHSRGCYVARSFCDSVNEEQTAAEEARIERERQAAWQAFLKDWNECSTPGSVEACNRALAYPRVNDQDRNQLMAWRDSNRDRQQAEIQRRNAEIERRAQFERNYEGCRRYSADACTQAFSLALANSEEHSNLTAWRNIAQTYASDRTACSNGSASACEQALHSPALTASDRALIEEWLEKASPFSRVVSFFSDAGTSIVNGLRFTQRSAGELLSTPISLGTVLLAVPFILVLGFFGLRYSRRAASSGTLSLTMPSMDGEKIRTAASEWMKRVAALLPQRPSPSTNATTDDEPKNDKSVEPAKSGSAEVAKSNSDEIAVSEKKKKSAAQRTKRNELKSDETSAALPESPQAPPMSVKSEMIAAESEKKAMPTTGEKGAQTAYILNLLWPGAGNVYFGQPIVGTIFILAVLFGLFLLVFGTSAALLGIIIILASLIAAIFTFGLSLIALPIGFIFLLMGAGPIMAIMIWFFSLIVSEYLVYRKDSQPKGG